MAVQWLNANGVGLRVLTQGPEDGEPLVFLHGFPETAELSWRHQLGWFAARGYRVIAIDQRGYNTSEKPGRIADYRLELLAGDVVAVIRALGYAQATVIGHDWGAGVTWQLADRDAEVVRRAVILNVPHGVPFKRTLLRDPRQFVRSWYILFFQLPWLPEHLLALGDFAWLRRTLRATSRPGTFTDADLDHYVHAWRQPGALRAMINWYRGFLRHPVDLDPQRRIRVPVLMLWGDRDRFLRTEMAEPSIAMCEQGRLVHLPEASHWLQHEEPARVNGLISEFLAET